MFILVGGSFPQTQGFIAFWPQCLWQGGLRRPNHSGRWVGAPVASLRCRILSPGEVSINPPRSGSLKKHLIARPPTGYKYSCSGSDPLAGFEVSTYGRFSDVHRGGYHAANQGRRCRKCFLAAAALVSR
jgi:hypothetical protein